MGKFITNEGLKKKFANQFELVSYAISLAENMILTGRDARVRTDTQNRAMQVLDEIIAGKDQFEPIIEKKAEEVNSRHVSEAENAPKEKKKARKILAD